jgi:hypothetical protein
MGLYEYIVGLLTIVSGLALTEIALRISRLIEFRRTVRWDVRPLLCVLLGVSTLIVSWSLAWKPDGQLPNYTVGAFVIALFSVLLFYLTIASALPSEIDRDTDLGEFYSLHGAVFWGLFTATIVLFDIRALFIPWLRGEAIPAWVVLLAAAVLLLSVSPIFLRNRAFQCFAAVALTVLILGPTLMNDF